MNGWQNGPFELEVKAGQILALCVCGLSQKAPLCDGSHKNCGQRPHVQKFERDQIIYVCGCQHSASRPFCDGTHNRLA